jgi:hypothetical protein
LNYLYRKKSNNLFIDSKLARRTASLVLEPLLSQKYIMAFDVMVNFLVMALVQKHLKQPLLLVLIAKLELMQLHQLNYLVQH